MWYYVAQFPVFAEVFAMHQYEITYDMKIDDASSRSNAQMQIALLV